MEARPRILTSETGKQHAEELECRPAREYERRKRRRRDHGRQDHRQSDVVVESAQRQARDDPYQRREGEDERNQGDGKDTMSREVKRDELEAHEARRKHCCGDHVQPIGAGEPGRARCLAALEIGGKWKHDSPGRERGERDQGWYQEKPVGELIAAALVEIESDEERPDRGWMDGGRSYERLARSRLTAVVVGRQAERLPTLVFPRPLLRGSARDGYGVATEQQSHRRFLLVDQA